MMCTFAPEPYTLHLLAGSSSLNALDAVKSLLDDGSHKVNELEPVDNLSPLHVAAAWDNLGRTLLPIFEDTWFEDNRACVAMVVNLAMCQLLLHYGANIDAEDIDKRKPADIAGPRTRKFLKKMRNRKKRSRLARLISYLFGGACASSPILSEDSNVAHYEERRSCPEQVPAISLLPDPRKDEVGAGRQQSRLYPSLTPRPSAEPPLPSRGCSIERELLSSDNSVSGVVLPLAARYSRGASQGNQPPRMRSDGVGPSELSLLEEEQLRFQLAGMSISTLRKKLRDENCSFGPINARNRGVYERKLVRRKGEAQDEVVQPATNTFAKYSLALQSVISDIEAGTRWTSEMGEAQEVAIRDEYFLSADRREVSFFCYLIIDPTLIYNASTCSFREFIKSIFYVGKGNRSRPLQHLVDAHRCRTLAKNPSHQPSAKLKRILTLWDTGHGVISLHISHNIHSEEAFVREAAMIEAIGLENLTNMKRGNIKGIARIWTKKQLSEFGSLLLRKAHIVFQNERCRQVFEADIEGLAARI